MQCSLLSLTRAVPVLALSLLTCSAWSGAVTYSSQSNFLANLSGTPYTEQFNNLPDIPVGPLNFSQQGFSYSVSAPSDLYTEGSYLGTSLPEESITIKFFDDNITAVGGFFFATNLNDDEVMPALFKLSLDDGTTVEFASGPNQNNFRGFTSSSFIRSLTISGSGLGLYANLDDLTVGRVQVPEPESLALVSLGLGALLLTRRRRS